MKRREALLSLLALGAGAVPVGIRAQARQPARQFRIALLPDIGTQFRGQFLDAMREVGWSEGREFTLIDHPFKYGPQIEQAAKHVVGEKPDLILATTEAYAAAAHGLDGSIPIVMWISGYPVEAGVAASLARPGKNVTGSANYAGTGVWGKLLELLRDAKPAAKRIGVLWDYLPPAFNYDLVGQVQRELRQEIARALGVAVHIVDLPDAARLPAALLALQAERPDALLVTAGPIISPVRTRVLEFALENRLPLISDSPWPQIELQPLLSYAASRAALTRQAAFYVVRILRDGAKPGELPIQQPAKFDLIVNLKTAKAIGLAVPKSILLRADKVIE